MRGSIQKSVELSSARSTCKGSRIAHLSLNEQRRSPRQYDILTPYIYIGALIFIPNWDIYRCFGLG